MALPVVPARKIVIKQDSHSFEKTGSALFTRCIDTCQNITVTFSPVLVFVFLMNCLAMANEWKTTPRQARVICNNLFQCGFSSNYVTAHYWQNLDLSGFKNLKGLALLPALNEKLRNYHLTGFGIQTRFREVIVGQILSKCHSLKEDRTFLNS